MEEHSPQMMSPQIAQIHESEPELWTPPQRSDISPSAGSGNRFRARISDRMSGIHGDSLDHQGQPQPPPGDPNPFEAAIGAAWLGITELGLTDAQSRSAENVARTRSVLRTATAARGPLRGPS